MEFSHKQMGNRSSGIQEFTCSADNWEPNVFHFWERYDSNVSLGKHNTTPEMEQFMKKVGRHRRQGGTAWSGGVQIARQQHPDCSYMCMQ
jgi:hypothetical protein